MTETEVARIERGAEAGLADLGLRLDEAKQLTAALQAEMVSAQVAVVGERRRGCVTCGRLLASKGHYPATFRSLFGNGICCKVGGWLRKRRGKAQIRPRSRTGQPRRRPEPASRPHQCSEPVPF